MANSFLWEKQVLFADLESTYGTAPATVTTPTAGYALACMEPQLTYNGEVVDRNFITAYLSRSKHVTGKLSVNISFKTEVSKIIASLGSYTNVPMEARLLQAAGLAETGTTVKTYTVSSVATNHKSCAFRLYNDGVYYQITGAVCESFDLVMPKAKPYYFQWNFKGLYAVPVDGAMATATPPIYDPKVLALEAGQANYVAGYFPDDITFSFKNTLAERPDMGVAGQIGKFVVTNREVTMTTSIETVLMATQNSFTDFKNGTNVDLSFTGIFPSDGSSNEFNITAPYAQLTKFPSPTSRDGITSSPLEFKLTGSAITTGDNEFALVYN